MLEGSAAVAHGLLSCRNQHATCSIPRLAWLLARHPFSNCSLLPTSIVSTQLISCQCILSTPAHVNVVVKMSTSPTFSLAASSSMPTLATWGEENTTLATLS